MLVLQECSVTRQRLIACVNYGTDLLQINDCKGQMSFLSLKRERLRVRQTDREREREREREL